MRPSLKPTETHQLICRSLDQPAQLADLCTDPHTAGEHTCPQSGDPHAPPALHTKLESQVNT